jgi:hypothetical protein
MDEILTEVLSSTPEALTGDDVGDCGMKGSITDISNDKQGRTALIAGPSMS